MPSPKTPKKNTNIVVHTQTSPEENISRENIGRENNTPSNDRSTAQSDIPLRAQHSPSTIQHTDCLSFLHTLADNSIDLIATDPPYEINYEKLDWDKKQLNWHHIATEFKRVLKDTGNLILFQGWSEVLNTRSCLDNYFELKNWIIYDRIKGRGAKTNLVSTREDILWYIKDPKKYTYNKISSCIKKKTGGSIGKKNGNEYRALSNVWTDISPIVPWSSERVAHPTQKPLALMERIVEIYSHTHDVVLDPFCGSGSTLVAAKKLSRVYMGSDTQKKYIDIAIARLADLE